MLDNTDDMDLPVTDPETEKFIRDRITDLRLQKGISEAVLSESIGQNRSYINGIISGRALPKLRPLLAICKYFDISPVEFFDTKNKVPSLLHETMEIIKCLDAEDMRCLASVARRMKSYED